MSEAIIPLLFLPKSDSLGSEDFAQKSSADEREAYKRTLSEDTAIKQNFFQRRKSQIFNLKSFFKTNIKRGTMT